MGGQRNIPDIISGGGVQLHRAGDAAVIEKVEIGVVSLSASLGGKKSSPQQIAAVFVSHGQGGVVDAIVHGDGEQVFSLLQEVIDLHLKGQKTPLVFTDLLTVQVHLRHVGDGCHSQQDPLACHVGGYAEGALVKDPAIMLPEILALL